MTWWTRYKPGPHTEVTEVVELPNRDKEPVKNGMYYLLMPNITKVEVKMQKVLMTVLDYIPIFL